VTVVDGPFDDDLVLVELHDRKSHRGRPTPGRGVRFRVIRGSVRHARDITRSWQTTSARSSRVRPGD
jgi:hypothetical protein